MPQADTQTAPDLEARIRNKGEEAMRLLGLGRSDLARACYAELAALVAQRPADAVRLMELERGLA